jgi:membrane-bound lytic murein transglycosylase D
VSLIRLILTLLFATVALGAQADDKLMLSTSLDAVPQTFTNAHDVKLTLLPEQDVWQRLRDGFAMPAMDSPLIAKHERWYASKPEYFARMTDRASRYLYYIANEVERRGMPSEIALLPMIESGFNPGAHSVSNASGIWQFIPATGRNFGLRQNWWYDGRRDIISATQSALDYLEKLHQMFGDWRLALAAYNWGEGAVQRAQEKNRRKGLPVDYESLKLPDETRNYLPKLIAIRNIVSNPSIYGLTLSDIPNKPYFTVVPTSQHIDVKLVAKLADISRDEFVALNPANNRPVILHDNIDYILLPVDKVETFQTNLQSYDKPLVSWQPYHAKMGERLDQLAPRFGLSLEKLKAVNGLSSRARMSTNETLLVPVSDAKDEDGFQPFNMHLQADSLNTPESEGFKVREGDTLNKLARRYHVSISTLRNWNAEWEHVKPGQRLRVAGSSSHHGHRGGKHAPSRRKLARRHTALTHLARQD